MSTEPAKHTPQLSLWDRFMMLAFGIKTDRRYVGFNWAAGALLRGESPSVVRIMATTHYDEADPWRIGALDAIKKATGEAA